MSPDLDDIEPDQTDDGYPALSLFAGDRVEDNHNNDRTHKCYPGGRVIAKYITSDQEELIEEISVPEPKVVNMVCYVLTEPFEDIGYKNAAGELIGVDNEIFDYEGRESGEPFEPGKRSEPYLDISAGLDDKFRSGDSKLIKNEGDGRGRVVSDDYVDASLKRADIAWAQAGVDVNMIEGPSEKDHITLCEMQRNRRFVLPSQNQIHPTDIQTVYNTLQLYLSVTYQTDVLYVVFTGGEFWENNIISEIGKRSPTMGIACYPPDASHPHPFWTYDEYFAFMETGNEIEWRVLAHEIGHILSRKGDVENTDWIFFPQNPLPGLDTKINMMRRITEDTYNDCIISPLLK